MSTVANQTPAQRSLLAAGVLGLPLVVMALYLIASRAPFQKMLPPWSDAIGFVLALLSGAYCVWKLVPQAGRRTLALLAYTLGCAGLLFMFSLIFVCFLFGDCL
jgi:membrane protease YdiL (CAAX protease family)